MLSTKQLLRASHFAYKIFSKNLLSVLYVLVLFLVWFGYSVVSKNPLQDCAQDALKSASFTCHSGQGLW